MMRPTGRAGVVPSVRVYGWLQQNALMNAPRYSPLNRSRLGVIQSRPVRADRTAL